jgi:hypothetical protein
VYQGVAEIESATTLPPATSSTTTPAPTEAPTAEAATAPRPRTQAGGEASRTRRALARAATLLPALAYAAGGAILARFQPMVEAPETAYLALLGGLVLAGAALLAPPRRNGWPSGGALLATVALWALPAGPPRGATLGAVLVATLLGAGWERVRRAEIPLAATALGFAGGALALQALLRAGELLPAYLAAAGAAALARLLVPPLLAGGALALLARRHGIAATITAGMAGALAAGGLTATAALPLLALAAVDGWRDDAANGGAARRATTVIAGMAVLALTALRPAAGGLALAAAAAWRLPPRWRWLPAALPLLVGLATGADPRRLHGAALLLVLLPFAPVIAARRGRLAGELVATLLPALLLAGGGALLLPAPAGLAAAAIWLALAIADDAVAGGLQRGWLGALVAASLVASSYPWLRPEPLLAALPLLGLTTDWGAAAALVAAAALLVLAALGASRRVAGALLAGAVVVAAIVALPSPVSQALPPGGVELVAGSPPWSGPVAGPVKELRLVSTLAEAAGLAAGTPVVIASLEQDGRPLGAWTLRAGTDTGEWAAARPDVAGGIARGPIWWSWVPPAGDFFAHAYAASWTPARPLPASTLRFERAAGLSPEVRVSLLRAEVSR